MSTLSNGKKHITLGCLILAALMLLACAAGLAEPSAALPQTAQERIGADAAPSEDLAAGYIQRLFYPPKPGSATAEPKGLAADNLNRNARKIFDALFERVRQVAAGELDNTTFELANMYTARTISAGELGLDSFCKDGSWTQEASRALNNLAAADVRAAVTALLRDCPYEMYWCDLGYSYYVPASTSDGGTTADWDGSVTVFLYVAEEYRANPEDEFQFDVSWGQRAVNAAAVAQDIAAQDQGLLDLEKLTDYKERICGLVQYNHDAADSSQNVPYGNPWQIVYVFDGDEETNVVCEGYSKAFQYLCDISRFNGDISVICVSGNGHMWNVVHMEDGANYLADLTNCDDDSIGYPDQLFLAGYTSGDIDEGYTYTTSYGSITYSYEDLMLSTYTREQLTMSPNAYTAGEVPPDTEEELLIASDTRITGPAQIRERADYPLTITFPAGLSQEILQGYNFVQIEYYEGGAEGGPLWRSSSETLYGETGNAVTYPSAGVAVINDATGRELIAGSYKVSVNIFNAARTKKVYTGDLLVTVTASEAPEAPDVLFDHTPFFSGMPISGYINGEIPENLEFRVSRENDNSSETLYSTVKGNLTLENGRFSCESFGEGTWDVIMAGQYDGLWSYQVGQKVKVISGTDTTELARVAENTVITIPAEINRGTDIPVNVQFPADLSIGYRKQYRYLDFTIDGWGFGGPVWDEDGHVNNYAGFDGESDTSIDFVMDNKNLAPGVYYITVRNLAPTDDVWETAFTRVYRIIVLDTEVPPAPSIELKKDQFYYAYDVSPDYSLVFEGIVGTVLDEGADSIDLTCDEAGSFTTGIVDGEFRTNNWLGVGTWNIRARVRINNVWSEETAFTATLVAYPYAGPQIGLPDELVASKNLPFTITIPNAETYGCKLVRDNITIAEWIDRALTDGTDTLEITFAEEMDAELRIWADLEDGGICGCAVSFHVTSQGEPGFEIPQIHLGGTPSFMQPMAVSWDAVEGAQYRVWWGWPGHWASSGIINETHFTFDPVEYWDKYAFDQMQYVELEILLPGYDTIFVDTDDFEMEFPEDSRVQAEVNRRRLILGGHGEAAITINAPGADEILLFCLNYGAEGEPVYSVYPSEQGGSAQFWYCEEWDAEFHQTGGDLKFYASARFGNQWSGISNIAVLTIAEEEAVSVFGAPDLILPGALTAIEEEAFRGVSAHCIRIPGGVSRIGDYAFADCLGLEQIYIPVGVTQIGDHAFDGASADLEVFGASGSAAETFAQLHGLIFIPVD